MAKEDLTRLLRDHVLTPEEICPVVYALSIIGQKWKIPILWHLGESGTLRYNEIKHGIHGITNIMLTNSLRELEAHGLVNRVQYNEVPPHVEYSMTDQGKTLIPLLRAIDAWGREQMENDLRTAENQEGNA